MEFPQPFQNQRTKVTMVSLIPGVQEDVDADESMEVLPECFIHESLEYGMVVDQAILYNPILIVAIRGHKCSLPFICI